MAERINPAKAYRMCIDSTGLTPGSEVTAINLFVKLGSNQPLAGKVLSRGSLIAEQNRPSKRKVKP